MGGSRLSANRFFPPGPEAPLYTQTPMAQLPEIAAMVRSEDGVMSPSAGWREAATRAVGSLAIR